MAVGERVVRELVVVAVAVVVATAVEEVKTIPCYQTDCIEIGCVVTYISGLTCAYHFYFDTNHRSMHRHIYIQIWTLTLTETVTG